MRKEFERPVFIVGCPRSGTTLLRLMLDAHPNLSAGPESHLLSGLSTIMNNKWSDLRRFGLPKDYWHQQFARLFSSFQKEYARRRGKNRWIDKTPQNAHYLDFVDALFPDSQIVHVIRNGKDVVASHRHTWGYRSALTCVEKWKHYITTARNFGKRVSPDRFYELRYEKLVEDPEGTMRKLLEYLCEPWDDRVIHFDDVPHDVHHEHIRYTQKRRAESNGAQAIYNSRIKAGENELDPLLRAMYFLRARPIARQLGYE